MECPKCGSSNVTVNTFQEDRGSVTTVKTRSRYQEKGHGCLWWLLIGWWWWIVDLLLWIFWFFPRLILRLFAAPFRKRKYRGTSSSISTTVSNVVYRTICTCQNCGHSWTKK